MNLPLIRNKSQNFQWGESKEVFTRLWLVGAPGAGKTFIANHLEKIEGFQVLRIGDILRKEIGAKTFAQMKNPHAPSETNTRVGELIIEAIEKQNKEGNRPLVIDSSPRNSVQLTYIPSFRNPLNAEDLVIFVHAEEGIRNARISRRGADDSILAHRATYSWGEVEKELMAKIVDGGISVTTFDNTQDNE